MYSLMIYKRAMIIYQISLTIYLHKYIKTLSAIASAGPLFIACYQIITRTNLTAVHVYSLAELGYYHPVCIQIVTQIDGYTGTPSP